MPTPGKEVRTPRLSLHFSKKCVKVGIGCSHIATIGSHFEL